MSETSGRLIPLSAESPVENMAIDQSLLESVGSSGRPVLRFYQWSQPTLSIGYFQKIGDRSRHSESRQIACVRRATGGGAIVHHHELTYSMILPMGDSAGPQLDLYAQIHDAFATILRDHGVRAVPYRRIAKHPDHRSESSFLCFQRRTAEDLIVSGYKVLGSAQRKARGGLLQHGSLLLRSSQWAPQLPGIEDLTSRSIAIESLSENLAEMLRKMMRVHWIKDELTDREKLRVPAVASEKFAAQRWNLRR